MELCCPSREKPLSLRPFPAGSQAWARASVTLEPLPVRSTERSTGRVCGA